MYGTKKSTKKKPRPAISAPMSKKRAEEAKRALKMQAEKKAAKAAAKGPAAKRTMRTLELKKGDKSKPVPLGPAKKRTGPNKMTPLAAKKKKQKKAY